MADISSQTNCSVTVNTNTTLPSLSLTRKEGGVSARPLCVHHFWTVDLGLLQYLAGPSPWILSTFLGVRQEVAPTGSDVSDGVITTPHYITQSFSTS